MDQDEGLPTRHAEVPIRFLAWVGGLPSTRRLSCVARLNPNSPAITSETPGPKWPARCSPMVADPWPRGRDHTARTTFDFSHPSNFSVSHPVSGHAISTTPERSLVLDSRQGRTNKRHVAPVTATGQCTGSPGACETGLIASATFEFSHPCHPMSATLSADDHGCSTLVTGAPVFAALRSGLPVRGPC